MLDLLLRNIIRGECEGVIWQLVFYIRVGSFFYLVTVVMFHICFWDNYGEREVNYREWEGETKLLNLGYVSVMVVLQISISFE